MLQIRFPTTAGELGALFGAEVIGDPTAQILRLSSLDRARSGALSFYADPGYGQYLSGAQGSVLFTRGELAKPDLGLTYLVVEDPKRSFAQVAKTFLLHFPWKGISEKAEVDPTAQIHATAQVGPFVTIGAGACVGARTRIYPFVYLGESVTVGEDCEIHPHATVHPGVRIGNRTRIFSSAVIGSEGFGFFREGGTGPYQVMPHIGTVTIEDDVRVGALVVVDRATLNETRIGRGTKIDGQCFIAHNCTIGEDVVVAGQAGLAGTVTLEKDVLVGGRSCFKDGVHVGEGAQIGMASGVLSNVPARSRYSFSPAIPMPEFLRSWKVFRRLPELAARLKRLENGKNSSPGNPSDT